MRTVLITGASRGIGAAIAEHYLDQGWNVLRPSREQLDLASRSSVDHYLSTNPEVSVLVNNAGDNIINDIASTRLEDWDRMMQINLTAPLLLIKHCAPRMRQKRWGRIVNISSCYGIKSRAARGGYGATKAALNSITRTAAIEYGRDNVLVNSLCPGFVMTDLTERNNSSAEIHLLAEKTSLGRLAQPGEIAKIAFFLGSENNTYITGQMIIADGGFLIQ